MNGASKKGFSTVQKEAPAGVVPRLPRPSAYGGTNLNNSTPGLTSGEGGDSSLAGRVTSLSSRCSEKKKPRPGDRFPGRKRVRPRLPEPGWPSSSTPHPIIHS